MKTVFILNLILICSATTFGQIYLGDQFYTLNFEDTTTLQHLRIDTISNPNNIWQVGPPQKTVFTNAYSAPNVIITDTVNTYPVNDTSVFEIINVADGGGYTYSHTAILSGYYQVHSDSLNDYGLIEFSPDMGTTWIDIINDTAYVGYYCWWYGPKPTLTGNSNGWQNFYVNLAPLGLVFNIDYNDTVLFRFTFISDSIQTNKDGLMYDDLHFEDWVEAIEEFDNQFYSTSYPNPANEFITIEFDNNGKAEHELAIFDITGNCVLHYYKTCEDYFNIDLSNLIPGVYYYHIINLSNNKTALGKILKE